MAGIAAWNLHARPGRLLSTWVGNYGDLVEAARQAVTTGAPVDGLAPLEGGLTHDVFAADAGGEKLAIKVYRSWERSEPEREWRAMKALEDLDLGPRPVWFSPPDGRHPPVVVMSWVEGQGRHAGELDPDDLATIVAAHRALHRLSADSVPPAISNSLTAIARTLEMMSTWDDAAPHLRDEPQKVHAAGRAARCWLELEEPDLFAGGPPEVLGRGDPNLTNYLWVGERVTMIDFEDAGGIDPAIELADFFEHASSRALSPNYWSLLCDLYELDEAGRRRAQAGRNLLACFWLAVLHRRASRGAEPVNLTLQEQAERVIELLG